MGEDLDGVKVFINEMEFKGIRDIEFKKETDQDIPEYKSFPTEFSGSGTFYIDKRLRRKLKWFLLKIKNFITNLFK